MRKAVWIHCVLSWDNSRPPFICNASTSGCGKIDAWHRKAIRSCGHLHSTLLWANLYKGYFEILNKSLLQEPIKKINKASMRKGKCNGAHQVRTCNSKHHLGLIYNKLWYPNNNTNVQASAHCDIQIIKIIMLNSLYVMTDHTPINCQSINIWISILPSIKYWVKKMELATFNFSIGVLL